MLRSAKFLVSLAVAIVECSWASVPIAASGARVALRWTLTPGLTVSPGQQADRDFNAVEDVPWNSSFVVRVTVGGKPAPGRVVLWKTSDAT